MLFYMINRTKKPAFETAPAGATSIIGQGMVINGDVFCCGDLRIDGKLTGGIKSSAKVVIGEDGAVEGNMSAHQADISGKIYGNITIKDLLHLRGAAVVNGDIVAGKISMEPTISFNGTCTMQHAAQVIEFNHADVRKRTAEQ
jgi:cytoskeletal protein CcmA (bactofilin family)